MCSRQFCSCLSPSPAPFPRLTFLPVSEIDEICAGDINKAKERLAYEVTKEIHGKEEADGALAGAKAAFGVPAVKGIEFGAGFELARMRGSASNDPFRYENGSVVTETNNCGGILGGITDGMPVIFRAAVKPTPSISKPQKTVDLQTGENAELEVRGRHDPCIVPRAVPVIEAAAAIAVLNLM